MKNMPSSLALNKYISEMQNPQILDKNIHSISTILQLKCQTSFISFIHANEFSKRNYGL